MNIITNQTILALWHSEVKRAEDNCLTVLRDEVEAYLVFLLMRYTTKPEIITEIVSSNFLESMQRSGNSRYFGLQTTADQCLILTGLFPSIAERRHVKISYFVGMGRTCYAAIPDQANDLYKLLAMHFVKMMDVLQSIRAYSKQWPDLLPLKAFELWDETGSSRALKTLKTYTGATPLKYTK